MDLERRREQIEAEAARTAHQVDALEAEAVRLRERLIELRGQHLLLSELALAREHEETETPAT